MSQNKKIIALGLMSGTSADGVDFGLIETDGEKYIKLLQHGFKSYTSKLREAILEAYKKGFSERTKELEKDITLFQANATKAFMKDHKIENITLIGFHGQTIYHVPPLYDKKGACIRKGKTCQLGNGELLCKELHLPVVYDFRSNDMHHNGQGAPLVPIFHWALIQSISSLAFPLAWVNIGGVSNMTFIPQKNSSPEEIIAFDIGPGNALIDDWVSYKTKNEEKFDQGGKYASLGQKNEILIKKWLKHPYLKDPYPKSMDRNLFNGLLEECKDDGITLEDGAATLATFTVRCIKKHLQSFPVFPKTLLVSGGGTYNTFLYNQLKDLVQQTKKTDDFNWHSDAIEAYAFGYLASRNYLSLPISFPSTTKVSTPQTGGILLYPSAL